MFLSMGLDGRFKVALRKESVDRNTLHAMFFLGEAVALRKESVDRNFVFDFLDLSDVVALRKESVDRNLWWGVRKAVGSLMSLSARRAWIEMAGKSMESRRNCSRSPQGERG